MSSLHQTRQRAEAGLFKSFASSAPGTDQVHMAGLVRVMVSHPFLQMRVGEDVQLIEEPEGPVDGGRMHPGEVFHNTFC